MEEEFKCSHETSEGEETKEYPVTSVPEMSNILCEIIYNIKCFSEKINSLNNTQTADLSFHLSSMV